MLINHFYDALPIFVEVIDAYSDTKVRVKHFELHIDCQLSKRGVIYLFHSRKIHISSESKLDTWVISLLLFDFLYVDINIS